MTGCHTEKSRDTPCHSTYAGVSYDTVSAAAAIKGYSGYSSQGSSVSTTPSSRIDEMSDKIMAQLINLSRRARPRLLRGFSDRRR